MVKVIGTLKNFRSTAEAERYRQAAGKANTKIVYQREVNNRNNSSNPFNVMGFRAIKIKKFSL